MAKRRDPATPTSAPSPTLLPQGKRYDSRVSPTTAIAQGRERAQAPPPQRTSKQKRFLRALGGGAAMPLASSATCAALNTAPSSGAVGISNVPLAWPSGCATGMPPPYPYHNAPRPPAPAVAPAAAPLLPAAQAQLGCGVATAPAAAAAAVTREVAAEVAQPCSSAQPLVTPSKGPDQAYGSSNASAASAANRGLPEAVAQKAAKQGRQKVAADRAPTATAAATGATIATATATAPAPKSRKGAGAKWLPEEDAKLRAIKLAEKDNPKSWRLIVELLGSNRTVAQCHHRWNEVLKPGLKRGPFTKDEDDIIRAMVAQAQQAGCGHSSSVSIRWSEVAAKLSGRNGKHCRDRWYNHLDPQRKRGEWDRSEDLVLYNAQQILGNKWCDIAKLLPGRTENTIKNRWHSAALKRWVKTLTTGTGTSRSQVLRPKPDLKELKRKQASLAKGTNGSSPAALHQPGLSLSPLLAAYPIIPLMASQLMQAQQQQQQARGAGAGNAKGIAAGAASGGKGLLPSHLQSLLANPIGLPSNVSAIGNQWATKAPVAGAVKLMDPSVLEQVWSHFIKGCNGNLYLQAAKQVALMNQLVTAMRTASLEQQQKEKHQKQHQHHQPQKQQQQQQHQQKHPLQPQVTQIAQHHICTTHQIVSNQGAPLQLQQAQQPQSQKPNKASQQGQGPCSGTPHLSAVPVPGERSFTGAPQAESLANAGPTSAAAPHVLSQPQGGPVPAALPGLPPSPLLSAEAVPAEASNASLSQSLSQTSSQTPSPLPILDELVADMSGTSFRPEDIDMLFEMEASSDPFLLTPRQQSHLENIFREDHGKCQSSLQHSPSDLHATSPFYMGLEDVEDQLLL